MFDKTGPVQKAEQITACRSRGPDGLLAIQSVSVDPEEPRDLLIQLEKKAAHTGLMFSYAWETPGAIRDSWSSPDAPDVKRWALPRTA